MTIQRDEIDRMEVGDLESGVALPLVTPGAILKDEFMEPLKLSARGLARALGVLANRVTGIINGDRAITAETAILMARHFGNSARFWMNLQVDYELRTAEKAMDAA